MSAEKSQRMLSMHSRPRNGDAAGKAAQEEATINPLEAWNLIMNAAGLAPLTKRDHIQIDQAGQVVHTALTELAGLNKSDPVKLEPVPKAAPDKKG